MSVTAAAGEHVIDALTGMWGEWYQISPDESGRVRWRRRDGLGGEQYAADAGQAGRDIAADYELHPVWMEPRP